MSGNEVYIPRLVRGLSKCGIMMDGISNWEAVDIYDISDIVIPQMTFGLEAWWSDIGRAPAIFPTFPADIEEALQSNNSDQTQVCCNMQLQSLLICVTLVSFAEITSQTRFCNGPAFVIANRRYEGRCYQQ